MVPQVAATTRLVEVLTMNASLLVAGGELSEPRVEGSRIVAESGENAGESMKSNLSKMDVIECVNRIGSSSPS